MGAAGQGVVLPGGVPLTTVLSGQNPANPPQTPVIIVMPSGWDPNGGSVQFAPREVSPEVPLDYWPMSSRSPLGQNDNRGVLKWPKLVRDPDRVLKQTSGPNAQPVQASQEPLFQPRDDEPVAKRDEKAGGLFGWWDRSQSSSSKALLASGGASQPAQQNPADRPGRPSSKALFSFWNKDKEETTEPQAPRPNWRTRGLPRRNRRWPKCRGRRRRWP